MFIPTRSIHNYNTRKATNGIFPTHFNMAYSGRSFGHTGSRMWNSIHNDVQTAETLNKCESSYNYSSFAIGNNP